MQRWCAEGPTSIRQSGGELKGESSVCISHTVNWQWCFAVLLYGWRQHGVDKFHTTLCAQASIRGKETHQRIRFLQDCFTKNAVQRQQPVGLLHLQRLRCTCSGGRAPRGARVLPCAASCPVVAESVPTRSLLPTAQGLPFDGASKLP